jgi:hypothetical protein
MPLMLEAAWALLVLAVVGAITATVLVPWGQLIEAGQALMLGAGAIGIPLELVYFVLLGIALARTGEKPKGWYWASFLHHHLLSARARAIVLPWFYAGALAFLAIGLGILLVVLGFFAALRQS